MVERRSGHHLWQVIPPFNVTQQFNAKADFEDSSNFMKLRKAFHKLLLDKLGSEVASKTFTGEIYCWNT